MDAQVAQIVSMVGAVGALVPIVVGILNRLSASSKVKGLTATVLSIVGGFLLAFEQGVFEPFAGTPVYNVLAQLAAIIIGVAVVAQTFYQQVLRPTGAAEYIQKNWGFTDPKQE